MQVARRRAPAPVGLGWLWLAREWPEHAELLGAIVGHAETEAGGIGGEIGLDNEFAGAIALAFAGGRLPCHGGVFERAEIDMAGSGVEIGGGIEGQAIGIQGARARDLKGHHRARSTGPGRQLDGAEPEFRILGGIGRRADHRARGPYGHRHQAREAFHGS